MMGLLNVAVAAAAANDNDNNDDGGKGGRMVPNNNSNNAGLQLHRVPVVPTDRDIITGRTGKQSSANTSNGTLYYYELIDTMYSEYYQPNDHKPIKKNILQRRSKIVNTIIQRCKNDQITTTTTVVVNGSSGIGDNNSTSIHPSGRFLRTNKISNELEVMDDKAIALKIVSTVFFVSTSIYLIVSSFYFVFFFSTKLLNTTNYLNLHKIRYLHYTTLHTTDALSLSLSLFLFTEKTI